MSRNTAEPQVARPAWATPAPWTIGDTMNTQREALELLFGDDLTVVSRGGAFVVYTAGSVCHCQACDRELGRVLETTPSAFPCSPFSTFYACPQCHDKDCPMGRDHRNLCAQDPFMKELTECGQ